MAENMPGLENENACHGYQKVSSSNYSPVPFCIKFNYIPIGLAEYSRYHFTNWHFNIIWESNVVMLNYKYVYYQYFILLQSKENIFHYWSLFTQYVVCT